LDPDHERAYIFLGVAHEELGNMAAAVRDWRHALELNPQSVLAKDHLERVGADKS